MKIVVTGYTGQLGYDVAHQGLQLGLNMVGIGSKDLDITNKEAVFQYLKKVKPDAIIHCAAYTAVDKAEDDKDTCNLVNVDGTNNLAEVAKEINAKFMYISTDYVFNGEGEKAFKETDEPSPIGQYGRSKLDGEKVVKQLLDKWFIVRISWVFGINGNNFVKTMLRLAETRNELNVVGDQFGSPTYTSDLAKLLIDMIKTDKYGIYHVSNEGFCSWAEFAQEIFRQANIKVKVNSISTEEYPTRAVRPKNSRMSKQKLLDNGFNPLPKWQDAVDRYLKELKQEVK
ncbi:MAG: dTDP-4-dehydrorhamnose reductase [Bacillota bacterium]|uniref:dTDP-4-dehydrorhamnose reductase n=1 Tax=Cytobacillus firmus TaxID=1399 RepID=UPI0018CCC4F3|nr:dTDP-4-dehydrorhamnose reductase [Cytobacillus firmus]MBG9553691.1 dTDP-4-dehydrorhamnose reductase [Cytobacillus firmus]MBG9575165.1 dTDP-4-dehydrorhamnose reductase [Cytobacillus firmus]MED4447564.1 dTDP-4-dehydrorhamnose reductase [Cytobacillus firmus]MED4769675.1 dTDP-4-dehydrorhamnose reductase [Cytobacillus firmus]